MNVLVVRDDVLAALVIANPNAYLGFVPVLRVQGVELGERLVENLLALWRALLLGAVEAEITVENIALLGSRSVAVVSRESSHWGNWTSFSEVVWLSTNFLKGNSD
jgi:hypothetical protein